MRRILMRHAVVTGAAAITLALGVGVVDAQPRYERDRDADRRAEDCHFYARE